MKTNRIPILCLAAILFAFAVAAAADPLESGFLNPPDSARPQTWWHWMNGNITKAGVTADLEAMKQIGLGGATIVNVDCGIPSGPVPFMSPEWRDDFKFAVQEADRLGLELCVENCAGWSSSGGPWITATNAMQRVTTSELRVSGPTNFNAALPQPSTKLDFYRDIAVLAFPASADEEARMQDFSPIASASGNEAPGNKLTDGDAGTFIRLPLPKRGQPQFAQLEFKQPFSARAVEITAGPNMPACNGNLQVSDDGRTFRTLHEFAFKRGATKLTLSTGAEPVAARFWRLQFIRTSGKATDIPLAEINLTPRLAIENFEAKDGLNGAAVLSSADAGNATDGAIPERNILDLTSRLGADGKLRWQVPAGKWVVLRVGYTPTGVDNHPAPKEGTGLECDKLNPAALDAHWAGFMQKVLEDIGPLAGKALNASLVDSYEVGGQNWTRNFRAEFQKRRGYDPLKFLPTFTGRVVDSPAVSERFLWDVRRTISDLFAENYYGHFAELCRRHGLKNAVEPYTGPYESLQCGAPADVVMGEFWSGSQGHPSVKMAASIAHIYGKTIVGAESFTASPEHGKWQNYPYALKALGDLMFCQGLNRYVFHRYAMQPWTNRWPGMTMGQWGFHFERTETWWNQGKPWIDYITRCEFLLQQGRAVSDAAYFDGETAPAERRDGNPTLPPGYDFDDVDAGVLLHGATVNDGRLTLASGANYAVLVLPPEDINMTPETLEGLRQLVRAGATVVGPRPQHSPSLADYPKCDREVKKLAGTLWGRSDGVSVLEHRYGQGRVVWGKPLSDVFAEQSLKPDFEYRGASTASHLAFVHRAAGAADIYFVSNQRRQFDAAECTFRVSGKIPELWHPDTGVIETAPVWGASDGRTRVRLDFDPAGSVFVVFRRPVNGAEHIIPAGSDTAIKSSRAPQLKIQRAVYAATDGTSEMDVTAKLSDLAQQGQLTVDASNGTLGRDPAANHVKELRVDYTLDGKPGHTVVPENETLTLPADTSVGAAPRWTVSLAGDGSPVVKVWENGSVKLRTADGKVLSVAATGVPAPQAITGPWTLNFPPDWGAPASVTLDKLISWTESTNNGVRYFSGTATYEKEIEISADRLSAGRELWLDLGAVKDFAEVSLNGHDYGVLWKPPFRVNVTAAAKAGANELRVKVTNLWPNRLIGDEQLPSDREWDGKQLAAWPQWLLDGKPSPTGRLTFTTWHHWTKDSALLESGLLGPVMLRTAETR
jgi:hypothetical protein